LGKEYEKVNDKELLDDEGVGRPSHLMRESELSK
jgi:hypothetical protein